jgi:hydrogenase maturation protease
MRTTALVAGIGNIFLGDDGFGSVVAQTMLKLQYPPAVRVVDFGIRGFDLAFALLEDYELVILVDAYPHSGAPGSLQVLELPLKTEGCSPRTMPETHAVAPIRALELARQFGIHSRKIVLVGCQPETIHPNADGEFVLSPAVASSVQPAIRLVDSLLAPLFPEIFPTTNDSLPKIVYA